jgi:hypothetical protein
MLMPSLLVANIVAITLTLGSLVSAVDKAEHVYQYNNKIEIDHPKSEHYIHIKILEWTIVPILYFVSSEICLGLPFLYPFRESMGGLIGLKVHPYFTPLSFIYFALGCFTLVYLYCHIVHCGLKTQRDMTESTNDNQKFFEKSMEKYQKIVPQILTNVNTKISNIVVEKKAEEGTPPQEISCMPIHKNA